MDFASIDFTSVFNIAAIAGSAVVLLPWLKSTIYTLRENNEALITSFGKLVRTEQNPGLKLKWPWPFNTITAMVPTDMRQVEESLQTKTKDDLFVNLPITIQYKVSDSAAFYFKNREAVELMKTSISGAVRTAASDKNFQDLYGDRDGLSDSVIEHTKDRIAKLGLHIDRIIIDQPEAPQEVQRSFNEVKASERLKEAAKNKAEAHKIEVVAKAEADKEALGLAGKGAADFRKALFDGYDAQITSLTASGKINHEDAIKIVTKAMTLDAMREVGQHGNMFIVPVGFGEGGGDLAELNALKNLAANRSPAPTSAVA